MTRAAIQPAVHELQANVLYLGTPERHGDDPYWALCSAIQELDGGISNVAVEIDGEEWTLSLGGCLSADLFVLSGTLPQCLLQLPLHQYRLRKTYEKDAPPHHFA